jgi:hypothetical protein
MYPDMPQQGMPPTRRPDVETAQAWNLAGRCAEQGAIAQPGTPDTDRALLKPEQKRWGPVIKAAAITAE